MKYTIGDEMEIVPAGDQDVQVLAALLGEMDDDDPQQATANDAERMRAVLADMAAYPFFRPYLVLENRAPVASFSLMIFSSPSHQGSKQAMLDAVVVRRTHRGKGIGGTMIQFALKLAREEGCYKMTLSSNLKRQDAHRFYQQLGFIQHGISFSIPLAE